MVAGWAQQVWLQVVTGDQARPIPGCWTGDEEVEKAGGRGGRRARDGTEAEAWVFCWGREEAGRWNARGRGQQRPSPQKGPRKTRELRRKGLPGASWPQPPSLLPRGSPPALAPKERRGLCELSDTVLGFSWEIFTTWDRLLQKVFLH